jgi:hypothetical protein
MPEWMPDEISIPIFFKRHPDRIPNPGVWLSIANHPRPVAAPAGLIYLQSNNLVVRIMIF